MAAQYVVVALKVENIHSGWLSSGKLVAPKVDNIHTAQQCNPRTISPVCLAAMRKERHLYGD